jgi:hypothetical protein
MDRVQRQGCKIREETKMRRIVALLVVLAVVVVFSGVSLAGGFGFCDSSSHVNQAQTDKVDAAKPVAKATTPKAEAEKLALAQTNKPSKPAAEKN